MNMFDGGSSHFDFDSADEYLVQDWAEMQSYPMEQVIPALHFEPADGTLTGKQLRERLITPEVIAAIADEQPRPSLLQRLLKRR